MNDLDILYSRLLSLGFVVLKQAVHSGNRDWIEAEMEMLHNVPSLLGEENVERHRYYWFTERTHYLDWACGPGGAEVKSRMQTFYEPIWREMAPLITDLLETSDSAQGTRL